MLKIGDKLIGTHVGGEVIAIERGLAIIKIINPVDGRAGTIPWPLEGIEAHWETVAHDEPKDDASALTRAELEKRKRRYVEGESNICPICLSPDIEGGKHDFEHVSAWQHVSCPDCGAEWIEGFEMIQLDIQENPLYPDLVDGLDGPNLKGPRFAGRFTEDQYHRLNDLWIEPRPRKPVDNELIANGWVKVYNSTIPEDVCLNDGVADLLFNDEGLWMHEQWMPEEE